MPDPPAKLQMVGMIPMPDADYEAAVGAGLQALRRAMTPLGIDTAGLRPPPARMMPVAQDTATGKLFALVESCNTNYRPTAVPLSSFYPGSPDGSNSPPPEFMPLNSLMAAPAPPQDSSPGSATAGSPHIEALRSVAGKITGAAKEALAAQSEKAGGSAALPQPASALANASQAANPGGAANAPQLDSSQSERLIRAMQQMQEGRENRTRMLLQQATQSSALPDTTGLRSTVLGITATQDPAKAQAQFQKLAAEKASGLLPTGGIYQRLQATLGTLAQSPPGSPSPPFDLSSLKTHP